MVILRIGKQPERSLLQLILGQLAARQHMDADLVARLDRADRSGCLVLYLVIVEGQFARFAADLGINAGRALDRRHAERVIARGGNARAASGRMVPAFANSGISESGR